MIGLIYWSGYWVSMIFVAITIGRGMSLKKEIGFLELIILIGLIPLASWVFVVIMVSATVFNHIQEG